MSTTTTATAKRYADGMSAWLSDGITPIALVDFDRWPNADGPVVRGIHLLGWMPWREGARLVNYTVGALDLLDTKAAVEAVSMIAGPCYAPISMTGLSLADQLTLLLHSSVFNVEVKSPVHVDDVARRTWLWPTDFSHDVWLAHTRTGLQWGLPHAIQRASLMRTFGGK